MTFYIDSADKYAVRKIKSTLKLMIAERFKGHTHIVVLCIGTDRVTGDSLGPFVGDRLRKAGNRVYGTIHEPVHAKNLKYVLEKIRNEGDPFVIAVDAALGSHIGHITIADRGIRPGTALNKELPVAGNIGITGIVNSDSHSSIRILQNTRLSTVLDMSDIIAGGLIEAISEINERSFAAV